MNLTSTLVAIAGLAVGGFGAVGSAQALDLDRDPEVGAYYSVRFGGSRTATKAVQSFGVRLTDAGTRLGTAPGAAPAPLDLRFSPRGFDGFYIRGVDLAPRIRRLSAAEGQGGGDADTGTLILVGGVLAAAALVVVNADPFEP